MLLLIILILLWSLHSWIMFRLHLAFLSNYQGLPKDRMGKCEYLMTIKGSIAGCNLFQIKKSFSIVWWWSFQCQLCSSDAPVVFGIREACYYWYYSTKEQKEGHDEEKKKIWSEQNCKRNRRARYRLGCGFRALIIANWSLSQIRSQ